MKHRLIFFALMILLLAASQICRAANGQAISPGFYSAQSTAGSTGQEREAKTVDNLYWPSQPREDFMKPSQIPVDGLEQHDPDAVANEKARAEENQESKLNENASNSGDQIKSFWENVKIDGHIRVRQATDWERINQPTRNRGRLRARLAFTWTPNEEFKGGFRWTTGDRKIVLEPGDRRGAPLSYQDTGDAFDKFELNLDRIFITYEPCWLKKSFVTFGKFKFPGKLNPIFSNPIGDLVFDEAVQPEGIAAGYTWVPAALFDEIYLTAGKTIFLEQGGADESTMFFAQLWAQKQIQHVTLAGGVTWFDWNNLNADGSTRISFENNFGNEVVQVGPNPEDVFFASGFSVINPMLAVTYDDHDPCNYQHPIQLVWETFHNFESFDNDRDSGYSIGFQYGPAVNQQGRQRGDWKIYYTWNKVEQESVLTPVAQDDWQRATNFRGHWIGSDFYVRDNIELRLWILADRPILPVDAQSRVDLVNGSRQQEWRGRADLTIYY